MIKLKPGVRIFGIGSEIVLAMQIAVGIMRAEEVDTVITSCTDGLHSRGSLHYAGLAFDLRTSDLPPGRTEIVRGKLLDALGGPGGDFDVVLEKDHIHIEFQPKSGY